MEWIATKFKEILVSPRTFHSYKNGIFAYNRNPEDEANYIVYLDFNKVTKFNNKTFFETPPSGYEIITCLSIYGKGLLSFSNGRANEDIFKEMEYSYKILNVYAIEGLRERLEKALENLVKLNIGKQENEAF
jgi:hypothetical protein